MKGSLRDQYATTEPTRREARTKLAGVSGPNGAGDSQPLRAVTRTQPAYKPAIVLGLLLLAFVGLQCFLPLRTAVKIGVDEDFELSKATLCLNGYQLYTQIWNDQPPLYVFLLTLILKHITPSVLGPRLLTTGSALLMLSSVFILVLRINGLRAAALATGLLIASPGFLELSASCMQEIPALAPAVAALCVLWAGPQGKWRIADILGGTLFAVALQMKLIGIVYLPLAVLIFWLRQGETPASIKNVVRSLVPFAAVLALSFIVLNYLTGNLLLVQLQQSWAAHFASAKSYEYGSPAEHAFDWSVLPRNWDATVPALLGIVVLLRSARQTTLALLPLAWLVLTLVVFAAHRPWWAYYYVHNCLPLCWCAGVGIDIAWRSGVAWRRWGWAALVGLYALCALPWMGARLYLQEIRIGAAPRLESSPVLKEIERFKPFTKFIFTDQPIYSFHSGIPVPPRLAVISLKRFWTGDLTNARLVNELESVKPGLILLANDTHEWPFQELLNHEYQLVYQDEVSRLYARQTIASKAHY